MKCQAIIIVLLALIVLKLYPALGTPATYFVWISFSLLWITLLLTSVILVIGKIYHWIESAPERKEEKKELKAITKTLKEIHYMEKRVKKIK